MENGIIRFKCPHCQNELAFRKPEQAYGVFVTCSQCKNQIKVKVREKEVRMPDYGTQCRMARLVVVETGESFELHVGSNIIGRADDETVQDIAISGDTTVSRRSVDLQVSQYAGGGVGYLLCVLNAKNPVYVNNSPLHSGRSVTLRLGDKIVLGRTKLMLS